MFRKTMIGLAVAGLTVISGYAVAGLWPGFPIVGFPTICWGSQSTATGTLIGVVTGCPNQAPAGPTSTTGNELIPADIYNPTTGRSGNPATVLLSLGSLNALPLSVVNIPQNGAPAQMTFSNQQGGILFTSTNTFITTETITLPLTPINGQTFRVASNRTISNMNVIAQAPNGLGTNVANFPMMLSITNTGAVEGWTFYFNSADSSWYRLQ